MKFFKRLRKIEKIQKNTDLNQLPNDIRMKKISLDEAIDFLQSLDKQWVYIKYLNSYFNNEGKGNHEASIYSKFKIKQIVKEEDFIQLWGFEDKDNLCIYLNSIKQIERTDIFDEIKVVLKENNFFTEIYIKKYQPNAENRYNEILRSDKHIIVTEGKTDWIILKKALSSFQKKGKYTKLDIVFFEFDSDMQMGADKAYTICKYNSLFANNKMKIFLFDADVKVINEKHENLKFKAHGNNVYSFILPIPDFRKNTPLISIENYFSDDEIRTKDENGRRLYLVSEFDVETGKHKSIEGIYSNIGKDKQPNQILDQKVFKIEEEIRDTSEIMKSNTKKNIALSKNDFANNIYNEIGDFKNISFGMFALVFDLIEEIFEDYYKKNDNAREISEGVYLEERDDGDFGILSIHTSMEKEKAILFRSCNLLHNEVSFKENKIFFRILCEHFGFEIPIKITNELIEFIEHKIRNNFYRIELHIADENTHEYISHRELFSSEESEVLFTKVLEKIEISGKNRF